MSSAKTSQLLQPSQADEATVAALMPRIADDSAVCEIECNAPAMRLGDQRWYDTRPMLDPDRHCPEFVRMNADHITYAIARHLFVRHAREPHMLRRVHR